VFAQNSNSGLKMVDINIFINDRELEGPFYKNTNEPSPYIKLVSIFELLEAEVRISNNTIEINGDENIVGNIVITFAGGKDTFMTQVVRGSSNKIGPGRFIENKIMLNNHEYYITLGLFAFLTRCLIYTEEDTQNLFLWTY
jgi:hypothetical protein